ncbi:MAG TPA: acyltransferase [Anaerolineae bacterium]|nr:acyltransferase [Anaerolineae bacterium]
MLKNVERGTGVSVVEPVNLYGCELRRGAFVGPFVEIQAGAFVGEYTRISSHTFVCTGVHIGPHCFIGHGVMFINDGFGAPLHSWNLQDTYVGEYTRIGSNVTILPVCIGRHAIIGAGAVVVDDVPNNAVVAGNPARVIRYRTDEEVKEDLCE